jgi:TatD DNase family protein
MLIDCHAHLDSFSDDEVSQILERARSAGVDMIISAGTTVESSARSIQLSSRFPALFSGVGIHPMDLRGPIDEETYGRLRRMAASTEKVLVISEIGLDFKEGAPERALQYQAFREQIRLARDLGLPIVFHSREAHQETLLVLRQEQAYQVAGVMHYFQADLVTARHAIDLGFYISLARPLLRLPGLQQVAAQVPLENIVLETDAAPQPFKAKRQSWTEPRHVRDIAEKLATLQHRSLQEVEAVTTQNLLSLLESRRDVIHRSLGPAGQALASARQRPQEGHWQDQEAENPARDRG